MADEEIKEATVEELKPEEKPKPEVKPEPTPEPTPKPTDKPPESKPAPVTDLPIDVAKGKATPAQIAEVKAGAFFTLKQVALEFSYSKAWISKLVQDGRIKAMKPMGGSWRIPASEIERLRQEGIPPLPRVKPPVNATDIVVDGKHLERVKTKEKQVEARGSKRTVNLVEFLFKPMKEEE